MNTPQNPGGPSNQYGGYAGQPAPAATQGAAFSHHNAAPPAQGGAFAQASQFNAGQPGVPAPSVQGPQYAAPHLSSQTVSPEQIASRIKRARLLKLLGVIPLAFAVLAVLSVALVMAVKSAGDDWMDERSEAAILYERYDDCQSGKRTGYVCHGADQPGAKRPKKPPSESDAPIYATISNTTYRSIAVGFAGMGLFGFLIGAGIIKLGGSRLNKALREDPTRVVIGNSRALEILTWIGMGIFGLVAMGRGLAGGGEAPLFMLAGLASFGFAGIVQLVIYTTRASEADAEGFRLGFGRRLRWKDFRNVTHVTEKRNGRTTGFHYKLSFDNGSTNLHPVAVSNWERLAEFINRGVGKKVVG